MAYIINIMLQHYILMLYHLDLYLSSCYYVNMKNEILQKLGHNIKVERVKLDYSQEKLAEIAGIQMQHLSKIENGDSDIKFTTLFSLLKALNVPFEKLYDINEGK